MLPMVRIALVVTLCAACSGEAPAPSAPSGGGPPVPPTLATFAVGITPQTVEVGRTAQAVASGADQAGNSMATGPVTWSSSDATVATASPTGLVTALAPGTVKVIGTAGTFSASASLTVVAFTSPPVLLRIVPDAANLQPGQQSQLSAVRIAGRDTASVGVLSWESSAPSVATVSATGLVTAVTQGLAIIRGSAAGLSGSVAVTVNAHVDTSLHVNLGTPPPGATVGDTLRVICTVSPQRRILKKVVASIDVVDFALDTVWLGAFGSVQGWGRSISLASIPIGLHRLVITAHAVDGSISADTLTIDREVPQDGGTLPVGGKKRITTTGGTFVKPPSNPKRP